MRFFLVTFAVALVFSPALGNPDLNLGGLTGAVTGAITGATGAITGVTENIAGIYEYFKGSVRIMRNTAETVVQVGENLAGNTLVQIEAGVNIIQIVVDSEGKVMSVGEELVSSVSESVASAAQTIVDDIAITMAAGGQVSQKVTDIAEQLGEAALQAELAANPVG
uniref:Putative secreted protein n=1 Tax=Lutzomyia longipalpis TaxID=7200 RepID=A0A1B0CNR2_LUTLO